MMAALMTDQNNTCAICFELRDALKIVGACKHRFCTFCLSSHFERQRQSGEALSCPTCHTECILPPGDVAQLTDFSADAETDNKIKTDPKSGDVQEGGAVGGDIPKINPRVFEINCQVCHHRGKVIPAANNCLECNQLYICEGCTDAHARNKSTKTHTVMPLKTKISDCEYCVKHHEPLTSFCSTCKEPACKICIQLDHGDHEVQQLSELIQSKVEEVKVMLCQQEQEFKRLMVLRGELSAVKTLAQSIDTEDKKDTLIKEIEDHTEKFIEKLIKQKEEMKAEVEKKFAATKEFATALDTALKTVTESIKKLNPSLEQACKLLSETKQHQPSYFVKLTSLQDDLNALAPKCDVTDGKRFHERLNKLYETERRTRFIPKEPSTLGGLEEVTNQFKPKLIAEHTLETDSEDKFIPCLANLGDKFAVAHPTKKGKPSDAVDIYEFPSTLKLTLKGDVGPVHDMSSTPDGQLAVLSDSTNSNSGSSIKLFDPNTGKNTVTHNLDIGKPMSLRVNFQNQYVVLSGSGKQPGKAQITVVNGDGSVELEQVLDVYVSEENPGRIACGWRYIFILVSGSKRVGVYEVKENKLVQNSTITRSILNAKDISASVWDHLFLADHSIGSSSTFIHRYIKNINSISWDCKYEVLHCPSSQADKECRISVRGCYTIMSWGQTFAVYQI